MRYLIIGLGIYGANLAIDLTAMGHEVIGADSNSTLVEALKDKISTAYIIDSTDKAALSVLPLKTVDLVIVAIGENFGASVKTVALLRKLGVKTIYARAVDEIHETILQGFKVDRILTPEQRAARELTRELELGCNVDSMRIDMDRYVIRFRVPDYYIGTPLNELDFEKDFNISLIAVSRPTPKRNFLGITSNELQKMENPSPDTRLEEGDVITVIGTQHGFRDLFHHIGG
ncbi:MAG: TrkA family potassium uptake protein [Muribaculum sp.]|nr:TrkA family potassium uptake protein [Muribaculum sp.]